MHSCDVLLLCPKTAQPYVGRSRYDADWLRAPEPFAEARVRSLGSLDPMERHRRPSMESLVQPVGPAQAASSTGQVKKDASMAGTFTIKTVLETNEEIDKLTGSPPEGPRSTSK